MKITVLPNLPYGDTVSITNEIISVLDSGDVSVLLPDNTAEYIEKKPNVFFGDYEKIISEGDVIIAVGGDGTVTKYASDAAVHKKPILGINGGHLGFLSGLEKSEISKLSSLLKGEYSVKKRMLLYAEIKDESGEVIYKNYCVNDAVIGRAHNIRMVDVTVELDGSLLARHRADGVIVATPTGSTAYSMSAGGPVADPHIECIIVTPICSHSLTARSVVCSCESTLVLKNSSDKNDIRPMYLVTDSREPVEVPFGGEVVVKKADITVDFINIKSQNFYQILQEKMIERNNGRG